MLTIQLRENEVVAVQIALRLFIETYDTLAKEKPDFTTFDGLYYDMVHIDNFIKALGY